MKLLVRENEQSQEFEADFTGIDSLLPLRKFVTKPISAATGEYHTAQMITSKLSTYTGICYNIDDVSKCLRILGFVPVSKRLDYEKFPVKAYCVKFAK